MSDFADLWNSATPSTKKPVASETLSSQILASKTNGSFNTSQPSSRVGTPSYLSANTLSPQINTQSYRPSSRTSGGTTPVSALNFTTADAFGDLFLPSDDSRSRSMTIAERKTQADKERAKAEQQAQKEREAHGAFWDQFEFGPGGSKPANGLSGISSPTPQPQAARINTSVLVPSRISPVPSSQPSAIRATPVSNADPWDLDSFLAPSQSASRIHTPASNLSPVQNNTQGNMDLFDLLDSSARPTTSPQPRHSPVRSGTPGDFDWGDREDHDDLLGELSKPVSEESRASARSPSVGQRPSKPVPTRRMASPPPHILGQIVEMGFSIQQAKQALAKTSTGTDVQAALDSLLGVQPETDDSGPSTNDLERFREEDAAARREHEEAERRRRRRAGPSRGEVLQKADEESASQIQERADQLLAQASMIGANMFSRANAFWKEGKEKALKAYEERAASTSSTSQTRPSGRPAWMQDEDPVFDEPNGNRVTPQVGFQDNHEDSVLPPRPQPQQPRRSAPPRQPSQPTPPPIAPQRSVDKLASLFSDTTTYVSPSRRKTPSQTPTPVQPSPVERRPVSPAPPPRLRPNPPVSATVLVAAQTHRTKGTEAFKLGQFGAAVDAYTTAIDMLPDGHINCIPLLNNRAAARAKAGDATGAIEDCTTVLIAIGDDFDPKREVPTPGVDLNAALLKALRRRAEVLESTEKWKRAREDWERLVKVGGIWAGSKIASDGVQGVGRCRRMEDGGNQGMRRPRAPAAAAKPKPKPRPAPSLSAPSNPDDSAVRRLKAANAAADAEGEAKHALKDSVDARIMAWKGGKETNIRALIAALDLVLWPELGWTKVGMHELVMPNQVKIKYVRAIAKVHPDKLNTASTTIEQKMIANSVFGALNEAWNAFTQ